MASIFRYAAADVSPLAPLILALMPPPFASPYAFAFQAAVSCRFFADAFLRRDSFFSPSMPRRYLYYIRYAAAVFAAAIV